VRAEAARPLFFRQETDAIVTCALCPHRCRIAPGKSGVCHVRANDGGAPSLPYFGATTAMNLDPIEKKPLYHFRPGSRVFSVGFLGCNLRCPFCQNWEISQSVDAPVRRIEPDRLIDLAQESGAGTVAYTYSEPLVHAEYVIAASRRAKERRLANVLVTNGCVLEEPARALLADCDAANVDLKTFNAETYRRALGGDLETVMAFIRTAVERAVHVEITTLVVTGLNDSVEEIRRAGAFIASLSADIPYHLSAYRPEYRYREPPTDPALLSRCAAAAREHLRYVYVGNIRSDSADTRCPGCGAIVVQRNGYAIDAAGLSVDDTGAAVCRSCALRLPFRV
jgi:pyruvate formate lyase activating enzyme